MADRPYVLLSVAMSIDGYIDDASGEPLALSNDADFDRVDEVRAGCDAILVGAGTIRADDPRLLVRSPARRAERVRRGLGATPVKVTLTGRGDLDPAARFFTAGDVEKIVYVGGPGVGTARKSLSKVATVVDAGDPIGLPGVLADLSARGVRRLMVEGGTAIHTLFLTSGLVDELHVVVAPFFVGDPAAPRFTGDGPFPYGPAGRMRLAEARPIGDVVLLRYLPRPPGDTDDRRWLGESIELSRRCPVSATAFAVGAIVVDAGGQVMATGYSREDDPHDHAEEAALAKIAPGDPRLATATIYSSLEPCTTRASRPRGCTELILDAGLRRVVFAWREPDRFADCTGAETLRQAGVEVVELPDLGPQVREINAHLFDV